ncbi:hypothetical protein AK812_SmicGene34272 [Symbiodinium microadriaticum]|uniref:Uncharacterized protein n=1 Tax=Symbiodinium microadriaticum TaxID=2951 RepID=A0A1Q9CPG7_SYMMI|nr:hypothetical protein AK812_SmicGene34272 [Symbiodinium microadriaticum]
MLFLEGQLLPRRQRSWGQEPSGASQLADAGDSARLRCSFVGCSLLFGAMPAESIRCSLAPGRPRGRKQQREESEVTRSRTPWLSVPPGDEGDELEVA